MHCPTCQSTPLEPVELEQGLVAAGCPRCNGALLALIQYRYWMDNHQSDVLEKSEDPPAVEEPEGAKLCPKCRALMTKYRVGADTDNRLDLCAHCDEAWLDGGEWQLLKQLDLHDQLPLLFTEAWQRNIRLRKEKFNMEKHFTQLIGEGDFPKVEEFKNWIDQHPAAAHIKHYINTNFNR